MNKVNVEKVIDYVKLLKENERLTELSKATMLSNAKKSDEIERLNKDLKDACMVIEQLKKDKQEAIEYIEKRRNSAYIIRLADAWAEIGQLKRESYQLKLRMKGYRKEWLEMLGANINLANIIKTFDSEYFNRVEVEKGGEK